MDRARVAFNPAAATAHRFPKHAPQSRFHRWRHAERLVDPAEAVVHVMQSDVVGEIGALQLRLSGNLFHLLRNLSAFGTAVGRGAEIITTM
jgi:hypothetical protein